MKSTALLDEKNRVAVASNNESNFNTNGEGQDKNTAN